MEPRRLIWAERAARPVSEVGESRIRYAIGREAALRRPYAARLKRCERRGTRVKCGCPGWRGVRLYTCRQHLLCERCKRARARRLGMRMREGLAAAHSAAPTGSMIVLLTLTIEHSGDIARDRADLAEGWRRFYLAVRRRWGKFPYVGVWEVTAGRDGLGHIHAHVAAVWPWRDWRLCAALWRRSCPRSTRISFVARRRDGRASDAASASNYLGKYLTKGVETVDFTPELRSRVLSGTYNTRWVFASRGFWQYFQPKCRACECPIVSAQYRFRGAPYEPATDTSHQRTAQCALALGDGRWRLHPIV